MRGPAPRSGACRATMAWRRRPTRGPRPLGPTPPWGGGKGAKGKFYSSMAPMVVNDMIVAGIAGGDSPMRGFLAAYRPDSGRLNWRFYTIPNPGEMPLAKTWIGRALETGG